MLSDLRRLFSHGVVNLKWSLSYLVALIIDDDISFGRIVESATLTNT